MRDWRDKGRTNHLLINRVMEYPKEDLFTYFVYYSVAYQERFGKPLNKKYFREFSEFSMSDTGAPPTLVYSPFFGWHDKRYLRCCMANLYEKSVYGRAKKNPVSPADLARLYYGYKQITGEEYHI